MPLTWIDTHVHWDAAEFDADRDQALVRARQTGVVYCLNPAVEAGGFGRVHDFAEFSKTRSDWPRILPAYGIHPLYVEAASDIDLVMLNQQIAASRPVAIGEIGLDGYPGAPDMERQRHWFEAQLALAATHELPVVLHSRHAVEAVIQSLKRVQGKRQSIPGGIAHAFNGSESQAEQLIRMGFLLGFGGSLTYEGSTRIRRIATRVPLTRIALETDAPDMSPVWLKGSRNESSELPKIAKVLAELREIPLNVLAKQTCENVLHAIPFAGGMPLEGASLG